MIQLTLDARPDAETQPSDIGGGKQAVGENLEGDRAFNVHDVQDCRVQ
nr:hypothetical protein [Aquisalimonas sp.]